MKKTAPKIFGFSLLDPTNGTHSAGDIIRWTGKPQAFGK